MNTVQFFKSVVCGLSVVFAGVAVHAERFVWTGAANGVWTNPANWTVGGAAATRAPGLLTDGTGQAADQAVFGDVAGTAAATIDLAGLDAVSYVEVSGAQTVYTFGTDASQIFPLQFDGALCVTAGAHVPVFAATFSRGRNYAYGYWSKPSGKPYPGLVITNNSSETLVIGDFKDKTGTDPSEMRLDLCGTGSIQFSGNTPAAPSLHPNFYTTGELVVDTVFGVREVRFYRSTGEHRIQVTANGTLKSCVQSYGLFGNSNGGTISVYGDGYVQFDKSATRNSIPIDTPEYFNRNCTIACKVKGGAADAGVQIGRASSATVEFTGENTLGGLVEIVASTLKTPQIGRAGESSSIGSGRSFLMSNAGRLLYTGAGETTDKSIVITNAIRSISPSEYDSNKGLVTTVAHATVEQAGTGPLVMDSTLAAYGDDARLTLASSVAAPATWTGRLADTGTNPLNVYKTGTGAWTLDGELDYTGTTRISAGTLVLASGRTLNVNGALELAGGVFSLAGGETATTVALPPVSVTGTASLALGAGVSVTISQVTRTAGALNVTVPSRSETVKITGLVAGDGPAWLTLNGVPVTVGADGTLAMKGTAFWKDAVSGDWSEGEKWAAGVPPQPTDILDFLLNGSDYAVRVTSPVSWTTNLFMRNASGMTTLAVSNTVTASSGCVNVGAGAKLLVGEGGKILADQIGAVPANLVPRSPEAAVAVSEGAELRIDGGVVEFTNAVNSIRVEGEGSRMVLTNDGQLSICPYYGKWRNVCSQLVVGEGAKIEVQGGRLDLTANSYASGLSLKGGELEFSGASKFVLNHGSYLNDAGTASVAQGPRLRLGRGRTVFRGETLLDVFYSTTADTTFNIGADSSIDPVGSTGLVEIAENADFVRTRGGNKLLATTVGDGGRVGILRMSGNKDLFNGSHISHDLVVGNAGRGLVEVSNGGLRAGAYGLMIGAQPADSFAATGIVRVTGGKMSCDGTSSFSLDWGVQRCRGTIVGDGTGVLKSYSNHPYGRLEVSGGSFENIYGNFVVGYGRAIGDVLQTGGTIDVLTKVDTRKASDRFPTATTSTNNFFAVGAHGGVGTYVISNGTTRLQYARAFIGGVKTNEYISIVSNDRQLPDWTNAEIAYGDSHDAEGHLVVAGGSFMAERGMVVGSDGRGVVELGPTGMLTTPTLVLSNATESVARFVFGPEGVGTATVGKLVVAPGAKLQVEMGAFTGKNARFPLFAAEEVEGAFDSANVEIVSYPADVPPSLVNVQASATGYSVNITRGTIILFR